MNKKYWISIILNDSISTDEIMKLVEESHKYTEEVNAWVLPANPKYFDIFNYCDSTNIIEWHQPKSIKEGDFVYIYVGAPISSIIYKYRVIKKDIPGISRNSMLLEFINKYEDGKYSFDKVKEYDLKAIRAPRRMPIKLLEKMESDEKNG